MLKRVHWNEVKVGERVIWKNDDPLDTFLFHGTVSEVGTTITKVWVDEGFYTYFEEGFDMGLYKEV